MSLWHHIINLWQSKTNHRVFHYSVMFKHNNQIIMMSVYILIMFWICNYLVQDLGVHEWDWVHELVFMPEGIKNVHALNPIHEPRSYISLWWTILHTPLFCRFIPLIFQKIHKKPPFILPLSTVKSSRKIDDLLGLYHSKQRCVLCVYIRLGA